MKVKVKVNVDVVPMSTGTVKKGQDEVNAMSTTGTDRVSR
jgi:hypothetical protein